MEGIMGLFIKISQILIKFLPFCLLPSLSSLLFTTNMSNFKLEDVAGIPRPATTIPGAIRFAPDGKSLFYLANADEGKTTARNLFSHDITSTFERKQLISPPSADTEANLSLEEKLRRERARQLSTGVTSYHVSSSNKQAQYIMIPLQGDLYVQDIGEESPGANVLRLVFDKQSTGAAGPAIDPRLSPDGSRIAFVQDSELYVVAVPSFGQPTSVAVQVTTGARGMGKTNGLADFIAQEEMDRYVGYWWSPCGTRICFEQVSESHIPTYQIMHQGKETVVSENHHYPFAGKVNPKVSLGVIDVTNVTSGEMPEVTWMKLSECFGAAGDDIYLARVHWNATAGGRVPLLLAEVENRAQTDVSLYQFCLEDGAGRLLYKEQNECWINLQHLFSGFPTSSHVFPGEAKASSKQDDGGGGGGGGGDADDDDDMSFVYGSEREGYMHLYLYRWSSKGKDVATLAATLTSGYLLAESFVSVSPSKNVVLFMGTDTEEAPLEKHLYSVCLSGGEPPRRLTTKKGSHRCVVNRALDKIVVTFSDVATPPSVSLCSLSLVADDAAAPAAPLTPLRTLHTCILESRLESHVRPPELNEFIGPSGHRLHYALFHPDPSKFGQGPHPLIVEVYGGPHVMRVQNCWMTLTAGSIRAQYLCDQGFLVAKCDNRGSARRGTEFEFQLHKKMGTVECDDQVALVNHLVTERKLADKANVGVYGWSYGGYMSAMLLCKAPETFHVAVAGAPVTHWDGYDTHYTERYMSTPQLNPEGYENGSVMQHVSGMSGRLMLVHGLIDENVHFRHTARLINALIQHRKTYDLLLFPEERHSPRRLSDRIYMEERISSFFRTHLLADASSL